VAGFRPILGYRAEHTREVALPTFASAKVDGVRAVKYGPELLSRTLKTIPNRVLQEAFRAHSIPPGYDGELALGQPWDATVYNKTVSCVMSQSAESGRDVRLFVFDNFEVSGPYYQRLESIQDVGPVIKLDQHIIEHYDDLEAFEVECLRQGYEGVVCRHPEGRYKYGRSTKNEQLLIKLKRFVDAEATIIGFEELLHNANEASSDERGYSKRSTHQENLIPMGKLGAFVVSMGSMQFNIGTGFTDLERVNYWQLRDELIGRLVKFKHFPIGAKDVPRHPVFLGFRSVIDI